MVSRVEGMGEHSFTASTKKVWNQMLVQHADDSAGYIAALFYHVSIHLVPNSSNPGRPGPHCDTHEPTSEHRPLPTSAPLIAFTTASAVDNSSSALFPGKKVMRTYRAQVQSTDKNNDLLCF